MKLLERYSGRWTYYGLSDPVLRPIMALGLVALIVLLAVLVSVGELVLRLFTGTWAWGTLITFLGVVRAVMTGVATLWVLFVIVWCMVWVTIILGMLVLHALLWLTRKRRQ